MSKYDDAFTLIVAYEGASQTSSYRVNGDQLEAAVSDIDARLAKLEAEAQATSKHVSNLDTRTIGSFAVGGNGYTGGLMDLAMSKPTPSPTQPQREPGWYWVKWGSDCFRPAEFSGERWWHPSGTLWSDVPQFIGPRIQPPEGAV